MRQTIGLSLSNTNVLPGILLVLLTASEYPFHVRIRTFSIQNHRQSLTPRSADILLRYSAQILCSILRFINSVHGFDPLSVRFFLFPGKPGQITCTSDCPFHFNCQVSYSFFRSMSNCFEPAIYLKRVKPFYLGTFYSIVKLESFQPAALISRADFFLHLSNGWNASFHMPLLFLPVCPPNSSVGRKVVRFSCHRIHSFLLWTWLPPHPLLVISKGLPSF